MGQDKNKSVTNRGKSLKSVQVEAVSDNKKAVAKLADVNEKDDPKTKTADKEAGTKDTSKKKKRRVKGMKIQMMKSARTIK